MTTTQNPTTTKRIAPGYYEIHTNKGIYEIVRETFEYDYSFDGGDTQRTTVWQVTWPGERLADAQAGTLRSAKRIVEDDLAFGDADFEDC